jgi:hypothetical protein
MTLSERFLRPVYGPHNGCCITRGRIRPAAKHQDATTSASRTIVAKPRLALSTNLSENKAVGFMQELNEAALGAAVERTFV